MHLPRRFSILLVAAAGLAQAQVPPPPQDAALAPLLEAVSPARLTERIQQLEAFGTRHTASETQSETRGIGAARRWIEREWRSCAHGTALHVGTRSHTEPTGRRIAAPTEIVNVVATLPGRDATRLIVVSGHYDSRNADVMDATGDAPGANDDASGTVAVMEMACLMAQTAKTRPFEATIVFAAVAGEEQGLLGAAQLARELDADGKRVEAMITNDIVGSPNGNLGAPGTAAEQAPMRVRLFADGLDPLLRLMLRGAAAETPARLQAQQRLAAAGGADDLPAAQLGRHLQRAAQAALPGFEVQLIARRDRSLRGGDHLPFLERGLAAVRFTEPFENYQRQHVNVSTVNGLPEGDVSRHVDAAYLARVTRGNIAGLATLAWAPAPPEGTLVDASELSNDTRLRWQPPLGGAPVKAYRVLWRRSDAAQWQHARDFSPDAREAHLSGLSRDDWVFAVQAIGSTGHSSLASFAPPLAR